jgi:hypothetical protein
MFIKLALWILCLSSMSQFAHCTTADVNTDINISDKVEVTSLEIPYLNVSEPDVRFGNDVEATDSFCVYSNVYSAPGVSFPQFQIGAVSSNGTLGGNPGYFISKNGNYQVEYKVSFSFNGGSFTTLTEGVPSNNISMQSIPNVTCASGLNDNLELKVTVEGVNLAQIPSGAYNDTLIVDIFPPV